ncbi:MAG: transglycosylase SLT domain-containing protein [Holophagaceae bacterium]|nr:transglycosylase SLT domain-containing protein [Holophagaceae bacterium]
MLHFCNSATIFFMLANSGASSVGEARHPGSQISIPSPIQLQDAAKINHLKRLIEAAEKALAADDKEAAYDRMDEADVYMADWPMELLVHEEVAPLLERINVIRRELGDDVDDAGINISEDEIGVLTEVALKTELELVKAAEADTEFDFPIDLNSKVLTWVSAYSSGKIKDYAQNSLTRGTKYMPMILQVLAEEGVPLDLAFLPIVESGFRNDARSTAKAVGMWQFIASTGKTYGLRIDSWVDERRDPLKATTAAARFLKDLHERTGDWYLALAGYNAGPGTVSKAINGTDSQNFWDHARSKFLRNETKSYVPQFCAAVLVGKHPERFGLEVTQLEPFVFETVQIEKSIGLNTLALRAGISTEALKDLNPELIRRITPPRPYSLRVPVGKGEEVLQATTAIPATERLELRAYKIKQGDNLAKVSARYNVTPEELLDINNITRSQFRVGRNIQVPVIVKINQSTKK